VSTLEKLKAASSIHDLAKVLGYKASSISYILYKLPESRKYRKFAIPKKSGGVREICAPLPQLRLLQRRLANILYSCRDEIDKDRSGKSLSHGFRKAHSILTNAKPHRRRRYVLNLDIEDYFPSFNFGRVRGYFIKNYHFSLNEKVATLIAQIACFENGLPQGSPCSPIIAELITQSLDVQLARLARRHKVTYTRYADDLTFSGNCVVFPSDIAKEEATGYWVLGGSLAKRIKQAGFDVNHSKTRMQFRTRRQLVTGLTVNRKVNVRAEYYRYARAMCASVFADGLYHRPNENEFITSLNPLEGILSHINLVREAADTRTAKKKSEEPTAFRKLYKKFLFYKYFARPERPLIVCEGKTDNVYLRYAIRKLTQFHPKLGRFEGEKFQSAVSFFSYKNQAHKVLEINGGAGGLIHLILSYKHYLPQFEHRPLRYPVILLIDNDEGAKSVFKTIKQNFRLEITHEKADPFYHLTDNLYLIKTPEKKDEYSCIEDLFDPELLKTKLDGKVFNPAKEHESENEYGKHLFAEVVVRRNADAIEFSRFAELLERILAAIEHYGPPREAT
jgi:retron-type reverse transcriptase